MRYIQCITYILSNCTVLLYKESGCVLCGLYYCGVAARAVNRTSRNISLPILTLIYIVAL